VFVYIFFFFCTKFYMLRWANTPVLTSLALPSSSVSRFPVEPCDCAHIAAIDASVKVTLDNVHHLSSIYVTTVTTYYDNLTSDKLPSNQNLVHASKPSLNSAAALKSVQILSKFWGLKLRKRTMMKPSHQPLSSTIQVCQRALRQIKSRRSR